MGLKIPKGVGSNPTGSTKISQTNYTRQRAAREYAQKAKQKPCADCGIQYPYYVMDFDHREDKKKLINKFVKGGPALTSLQIEIDKCDVVCSNCHRERTHQRAKG